MIKRLKQFLVEILTEALRQALVNVHLGVHDTHEQRMTPKIVSSKKN